MIESGNIALGFYQNFSTAQAVVRKLRKHGYRHFASIHHKHEGGFTQQSFGIVEKIFPFLYGIDKETLNRFRPWVIRDETLIIVQVDDPYIADVLAILRDVESGHPISFLLRGDIPPPGNIDEEITRVPLTVDQLNAKAIQTAESLKHVEIKRTAQQPLLDRLIASSNVLSIVRQNVYEAEQVEQTMTISAEWLLDNTYVIEGNIEEVQRNLPKNFYNILPKLKEGEMAGLPRVYAIAKDLIDGTANRLNRDTIFAYLTNYQTIDPLKIGELWAMPLMLRLRLIVNLKFLALHIERRLKESEVASFWGNRILNSARREPERLPEFLLGLENAQPNPSPHFAEELIDHLYDEETVLPLVTKWVEEKLGKRITEIVHEEQLQKAAEELALSNAVVSLITLSQISWPDLFESISIVDSMLNKDPAGIYPKMDFITRDAYRHSIELLAKSSQKSEIAVTQALLQQTEQEQEFLKRHVGYYLVDNGLPIFEKKLTCKPTLFQRFKRSINFRPALVYLGSVVFFTFLSIGSLYYYGRYHEGWSGILGIFLLLAAIPLSEIFIQLLNLIITEIIPPVPLPKLSFDKSGIPPELGTLVVIPIKLTTPISIKDNLNRLEIHYLANSDKMLRFALLDDFEDAPAQHMPNDEELLDIAVKGIEALNEKYGSDKFFLFHRNRMWSNSEQAWIGWERKRGKLHELNRYLTGESTPEEFLKTGHPEALKNLRYVITLDADTQLPKDKARHLIETAAHPLNIPKINQAGLIERGFSIIQPRVTTSFLTGTHTYFARLFSDIGGADPYTQTVSDLYQDLTNEGTYHGKGIYDLHAFHSLLKERYPNEHILSHDLIEGAYARVGLASDVILFDQYPEDYFTWSKRQHRWMRGDWQIIDWLFSHVPDAKKQKNPNILSGINRWKIFDNLRRALVPVTVLALLLYSWIFSISSLGTFLGLAMLFIPAFCLIMSNLLNTPLTKFPWIEIGHSILRAFVNIAILPHHAYLSTDAFVKSMWRRYVSHKRLLEWSSPQKPTIKSHRNFVLRLLAVSLFGLAVLSAVVYYNPNALLWSIPFCFLWMLCPLIIHYLDQPIINEKVQQLSTQDKHFLREIARKTWRYFDDFVGPQSNWLPPDNYQSALQIEVAQRTSPTNIGLWLLAVVSANDLYYITIDDALNRIQSTLQTLKKLEQYNGHLLNWFDIQTLKPLYPRYVSTVDSGNFLASLWTLKPSVEEMISSPILPLSCLEGIRDTFQALRQEILDSESEALMHLEKIIYKDPHTEYDLIIIIQNALANIQDLKLNPKYVWLDNLKKELKNWDGIISRYFSWLEVLKEFPQDILKTYGEKALELYHKVFHTTPSLNDLASGTIPLELQTFLETIHEKEKTPPAIKELLNKLHGALQTAQWFAGEKVGVAHDIIRDAERISDETNMRFLYDADRKLFTIGFNVDDVRRDSSFYDLLASEARITSLVAIAKGDVPIEHWWTLGRPYRYVDGHQVLLSWGGTMFEYLMPLLFNIQYPTSLIGAGCWSAVAIQISYAQKLGIPWGISEAAYSELDTRKTYQYRSFGVPELGFKRGLEEDLVVSPYSTALALAVNPSAAIKNFHLLKKDLLLTDYGFYESIDFTRQRGPHGERGVIVYAYMAHHQGMSLLAINNLLNYHIMPNRFHSDPRITGVDSIIYERIPLKPRVGKGTRREVPTTRLTPFSTVPIMGTIDTPDSPTPKVNLLANGDYSLMMSNSGGGYSHWNDIEINRWRSDVTTDSWGNFCYIKDRNSGLLWSTGYQPTCSKGGMYAAVFKADKIEIRRRDNQVETLTNIIVSPEDNAEIHLVQLANLSKETRDLELTTYMELSLAPHLTDRAHPAFNKLFIETEAVNEIPGLLAFRRPRSKDDKPIWVGHLITSNIRNEEPLEFETDRAKFLGRGRSLRRPESIDKTLSNTQGTVLDPVFSIRRIVELKPSERIQVALITVISASREKTIELMKKYADITSSQRALEMAWTHAQLDIRHLRIHQEEVQLFLKLASRVLYPHAQLRPSMERLRKNHLGQSKLWSYGISGDLPIVVVSVADVHEIDFLRQILTAHAFWRMRGLRVDLVVLNEEATGYDHPLYDQVKRIIQSNPYHSDIDKPGGIYLRNSDQLPEEDMTLILSVSRANLAAARGSLRQQLVTPMLPTTMPSRLFPNRKAKDYPSSPLPFMELPYFNGTGGYTQDGKEYVIYLGPNHQTPLPWVNVIANPNFGTMISEAGSGSTWFGNSQTNRLTPWSNDPILDPPSDAIYIRDEELGTFWSTTPSPVRELDAYRVRHGQGYTLFEHNSHGIEQTLLMFVPVDDEGGAPVKIQRLRLINRSPRKRTLSIYHYTEWVLGVDREETQMHVITEWDPSSQALFAYNRYNPDFSKHTAFVSSYPLAQSFTANRTEFLGRNGSYSNPAALKREALSGTTGAASDPCAALQVKVEIHPDEQIDIFFIMGYTDSKVAAQKLITQWCNPDWVEKTYSSTVSWWDKVLGAVKIDSPDLWLNFAFNRWLTYQNLSCRFWGRSAFYQSSGAYGFRDQLQDAMALIYSSPKITRQQILLAASRQFPEGDVQHWWHPPAGGGVRTRISDDLLWLPLVTAHYVRITNDRSILDEIIPFLKGDILKEDQHESYFVPEISSESGTLLDHCRRALNKGITAGPHGLPLIGGGDWNDGMNRVGILGRGESVWLGWFLIQVMKDFVELVGDQSAEGYRAQSKRLEEVIEAQAWDGNWYRRAYFDDGTPLGSKENQEDMIDSLSQTWAAISGAGNPERIRTALKAVEEHLVLDKAGIVLLLTPAFDKTPLDPGYIKGYPPGVRENGGQYTHGSMWVPLAFARIGEGDTATRLLHMLHPVSHTPNESEVNQYKVEPYVLAGDVYNLEGQVGRGGWSWYSGSAGWMYRVWLEEILGFKLRHDKLLLEPTLPSVWNKLKLHYQFHETSYEIEYENPDQVSRGKIVLELDGQPVQGQEIQLVDDRQIHRIKVRISRNP